MNEQEIEEPLPRRRSCIGCLARVSIAVLALAALVTAIMYVGAALDGSDGANAPSRAIDVGPAENYLPADLTEYATAPIWIVRLEDGEFVALYNRSSKQQEQGRTDCRVRYDENAQLIGLTQLEGFRGAFVEECDGLRATWRADGTFAGGTGYADLDRFEHSIDDAGHLIIDTGTRTCTRSRGVAGIPPFDVQTCRGRPQ